MSGKRNCLLAVLMVMLVGSGCCRWCDRWCNRGHAVPCQPCCPVAAPAAAPCCPMPAPTCYTPGTVTSGTQWQRTPGVAATGCCP